LLGLRERIIIASFHSFIFLLFIAVMFVFLSFNRALRHSSKMAPAARLPVPPQSKGAKWRSRRLKPAF
jgi:hypothetical protein